MKLYNGFTKLLLVAGLASSGSLSAAIITYTTTGTFSGSGTSVQAISGGTLTFLPPLTQPTVVNASPNSFVGFGDIIASTTATTPMSLPSGLILTITITQSGPTAGMSTLTGTLSGMISNNSSSATFTPLSSTTMIGGVTYAFTLPTTALVPPTSNAGDVSIQGIVTAPSTVPEPGTTVSLLSGVLLLGVGGALKIRQRS